ncbi:MAG: transposase [Oligoflexales bacterium]|nr:transposase [Oligoflexales bacterium]
MWKKTKNRSGSVTFVQRFGSALNLNVHFHLLQKACLKPFH